MAFEEAFEVDKYCNPSQSISKCFALQRMTAVLQWYSEWCDYEDDEDQGMYFWIHERWPNNYSHIKLLNTIFF